MSEVFDVIIYRNSPDLQIALIYYNSKFKLPQLICKMHEIPYLSIYDSQLNYWMHRCYRSLIIKTKKHPTLYFLDTEWPSKKKNNDSNESYGDDD